MIRLLTLVFAFSLSAHWAHSQTEIRTGMVIERVTCASASNQSYALYLPSNYSDKTRWPILYAFDPLARGRVPTERFKEAAERFGYIVAASNTSRNAISAEELMKAVTSLWQDTHERFAIDDRRVYATGFSGGARVANRLASACKGCIAGVISCGAGFPPELQPTRTQPYAFFGTIGIDDFNFRELRPLGLKLSALGVVSRVATFAGAHQWPPKEIAMAAIEWMELQAIKLSRRDRDDRIIDAALARSMEELRNLTDPVKLVERFLLLGALVDDFKGFRDVSIYERELSKLQDSKELKKALADERRQLENEQEKANEIISIGRELINAATHDHALVRLRGSLKSLLDRSNSELDSGERRIARRTLGQVYATTFEAALYDYLPKKHYDLAVASLEVAAEAMPKYPTVERELARALVMKGSRDSALAALRRAVEKGLDDAESIEKDDAFARLREEKKFREILDLMRAKENSRVKAP